MPQMTIPIKNIFTTPGKFITVKRIIIIRSRKSKRLFYTYDQILYINSKTYQGLHETMYNIIQ